MGSYYRYHRPKKMAVVYTVLARLLHKSIYSTHDK